MTMPNLSPQISIRSASSATEIETARVLLREYAAHLNSSPDIEHICLNSYEEELAALPGEYAPPEGTLLLAFVDGEPAGCIALKPLVTARPGERACEMKRLWVRPQFRGMGLGSMLTESLIHFATVQNYTALYLDTLPAAMQSANRIYRKLGFEPVERYRERLTFTATKDSTPIEVAFFRLDLTRLTNHALQTKIGRC